MGPSGKNALDVPRYADCLGIRGSLLERFIRDWGWGVCVSSLEAGVWVAMEGGRDGQGQRFLRGRRTGIATGRCRVKR